MSRINSIILALLLPVCAMGMENEQSRPPRNPNQPHLIIQVEKKASGWSIKGLKISSWKLALGVGLGCVGSGLLGFAMAGTATAYGVSIFTGTPIVSFTGSYFLSGLGLGSGALMIKDSVSLKEEEPENNAQQNQQENIIQPNQEEIQLIQEEPLAFNHRVISFKDLEQEHLLSKNPAIKEVHDEMNKIQTEMHKMLDELTQDTNIKEVSIAIPLNQINFYQHENPLVATDEEFMEFKSWSIEQKGNFICYNPRFRELSTLEQESWAEMWRDERQRLLNFEQKKREEKEWKEWKEKHPVLSSIMNIGSNLTKKTKKVAKKAPTVIYKGTLDFTNYLAEQTNEDSSEEN